MWNNSNNLTALLVCTFLLSGALLYYTMTYHRPPPNLPPPHNAPRTNAATAAIVPSPFIYSFNQDGVLQESERSEESTSPYWWLNSGGEFIMSHGVGKTVQGPLSFLDPWRLIYARSNPLDTENGLHPQSIFRLISRSSWDAVRTEIAFIITNDNFSTSPNRNASNGILLLSRYKDQDTTYYAGIRVDGTAVIKKKYKGVYYTLAQVPAFPGTYRLGSNTNLIPHNEWMGLRTDTTTQENGTVILKLYLKREGETGWQNILEAKDDGILSQGTPPITGPAPVGIRTDFMDVQFRFIRIETLK